MVLPSKHPLPTGKMITVTQSSVGCLEKSIWAFLKITDFGSTENVTHLPPPQLTILIRTPLSGILKLRLFKRFESYSITFTGIETQPKHIEQGLKGVQ